MKVAENPLAGGTFINWLRLLHDNRPVKLKYFPRLIYITFMTLLFSPLRLLQRLRFERKIHNTKLAQDPVFVLGQYRTGGTHFMNILTRDPQWGFLSTTQALLPDLFLLGKPVRNIFRRFLHETRPMDNMRVTPESPEEPEHAICNTIPYGFYQGICFPDRMMDYFRKSVTFEADSTGSIRAQWKKAYANLMQACTLANEGKQLLIKNPPDMARIGLLLELYPKARFIYIQRNPWVLYPSIRNFLSSYIPDWQLSDIDEDTLDRNILEFYHSLSACYQRDRALIPEGNLVEIKFEDFEHDPIGELRRIYETLGLKGFREAKPHFQAYIAIQKDYRKNLYALTKDQIELIRNRCASDIERWAYKPEEGVKVLN